MEWHKLTRKTMPQVHSPRFLLLRGYRETGGGILCVAYRDQYGIRYVGGRMKGGKEDDQGAGSVRPVLDAGRKYRDVAGEAG